MTTGRRPRILEGWQPRSGTWAPDSPPGRFLAMLRAGNYLDPSARAAGLGPSTVRRWLAAGREWADSEPTDVPASARPFRAFSAAVATSEASAEVVLTGLIFKAATQGDWRAAVTLLARRHPERWRDRPSVEVDAKVEHTAPDRIDSDQLLHLIRSNPDLGGLLDALDGIEIGDADTGPGAGQ